MTPPHRYRQAEVQGTKLALRVSGTEAIGASSLPLALRTPFAEIESRVVRAARGRTVLDYGCGVGVHSLSVARDGAHVIGCDISAAAIAVATRRASERGLAARTHFLAANGEALPLADQTVDVVMSIAVLSFVDLEQSLGEIRRVLRPGGVLFIMDTLGHNPVLNAWRRISVWRRTRAKWSQEHILKMSDIEAMKSTFDVASVDFFDLFTVAVAPFSRVIPAPVFRRGVALARWLDARLLRVPGVQRLAFKVIIELRKPHSDHVVPHGTI